jgi:hypothetical protein
MFLSISDMKETEDLRENKRRRQDKKLDSAAGRSIWYWLSAIYWRGKLDPVTYIYIHDGGSGPSQYYITNKEFTHSVAITFLSFGTFGLGLGQLIAEAFRW